MPNGNDPPRSAPGRDEARRTVTETKRRSAPRLSAELAVQVVGAAGPAEMTTVDVSRTGLFLHTYDPKPLRYLLRLRMDPSDGGEPIVGHGMVVRVVSAAEAEAIGTEPGMGIEFFGFGGAPRARWEALLDRLASSGAADAKRRSQPSPALQPLVCEAAHKLPRRDDVLLLLRTDNVEQLYEICNVHIPSGSMFVRTSVALPPGASVDLRIVHPLSRDVYDLRGMVERVRRGTGGDGLEISLKPGVETRHQTFADGLPEEEITLELVDGE
jgi:hypothetical protein